MENKNELPQVVEMEKSLLGALLLKNGEAVEKVASIISEDDFYRPEHRVIYRTILKLQNSNTPPNVLSVIEEIRERGEIKKFDIKFLLSLADIVPTTAYAESYAKKIREKSLLRKLIDAGEEITASAYKDQKPIEEILDDAERKVLSITSKSDSTSFEALSPIISRTFEKINYVYAHKGGFTGLETTFTGLDKVTNGLQKSDLILIAARPSMGKTAFALNLAMKVARKKNKVAIFSLEMSKEQLGHRLLSAETGIDSMRLNTGEMAPDDMTELVHAVERISADEMYIDDTAGISVMELRAKARRIKSEVGLDLIVIDYLQLMQGSRNKGGEVNRQQEISEISRNLKSLARELNVPVIALSQLSRGVELRAEKKPQLSDLRESGSLEQDADIVMFLYRDEYYNPDTENQNIAELIIAKNRNGPTTTVRLQFKKECMRFGTLEFDR